MGSNCFLCPQQLAIWLSNQIKVKVSQIVAFVALFAQQTCKKWNPQITPKWVNEFNEKRLELYEYDHQSVIF